MRDTLKLPAAFCCTIITPASFNPLTPILEGHGKNEIEPRDTLGLPAAGRCTVTANLYGGYIACAQNIPTQAEARPCTILSQPLGRYFPLMFAFLFSRNAALASA